jgi:Siphovirus ReqiPepy6 Gp37-like protein
VELFTLDRQFTKQVIYDKFNSVIWTQRYYGDSEVELVVPTTKANTQALKTGTFLGLQGSNELMILETQELKKEGITKNSGISLLKWLNNRFVRASAKHEDRYWYVNAGPGAVLANIVYYMCVAGPYLDGTTPTGIPTPQILKVPGLFTSSWNTDGPVTNYAVPYGPVFDALYEIATTYEIGQQIVLTNSEGNPNRLMYRNYKGLDRSSGQSANARVRFAPDMDSLTDIEELQSIANYMTQVYAFAPSLDEALRPLATTPGMDNRVSIASYGDGFDMRTKLVFAEDITTDQVSGNAATLLSILNSRALDALSNSPFVKVVDGEIVPTAQFRYGRDYNLGDIIEIQGNSGVVRKARVIEYIRSQDETGERAYPTVAMKD